MGKAGTLSEVREREFPIVKEVTYLNGASRRVRGQTRTVQSGQEVAQSASFRIRSAPAEMPPSDQIARERLARWWAQTRRTSLVFTSNDARHEYLAVQGIAWREGDNIDGAQEFHTPLSHDHSPSKTGRRCALHPVRRRGAVRGRDHGPHVDSRTRAVACSAIMWDTGYRADIETLGKRCADAGCLLIVDGIQWVGARQLDVKAARVSTFATHGYQ